MKKLLSPISLAVLSLCFTTHLAYGMENEDDWGQERSKTQQCRESNLSLYAEGKWGAYHKYLAEKSQLTDEDALFIFSKWEIIKEAFASVYARNDAIDHTDMLYNRHQHSESHLPSDSFNQFKARCDDYIEKNDITWGQSEFIFTQMEDIKETLKNIGKTSLGDIGTLAPFTLKALELRDESSKSQQYPESDLPSYYFSHSLPAYALSSRSVRDYSEGDWRSLHKHYAKQSQLSLEDLLFIFSKWKFIKEILKKSSITIPDPYGVPDYTHMPCNSEQRSESNLSSYSFDQLKILYEHYVDKYNITLTDSLFIFSEYGSIKETLKKAPITLRHPYGAIGYSHLSFLINPSACVVETFRILDMSNNLLGRENRVSLLTSLTNLTDLNVSYAGLKDVTPLTSLTNLRVLNVSNNGLKKVTPLTSLTNLTELSMSGNPVEDLRDLTRLRNLKFLELSASSLGDMSILPALNLNVLKLKGHRFWSQEEELVLEKLKSKKTEIKLSY